MKYVKPLAEAETITLRETRGLFIYYLPPYSPELNLIEILWSFIKYAWLPFNAYKDHRFSFIKARA